ncbi:hypothetical protein M413DRAFT_444704 [Hebeloma cylindrosporum]|uniref:Uncharacterized protein n=1 Tax=Hebeloma cylindrosporum TaxID=76867 RepID=A0A0C3C074_HEBCY|nr:hypothetical protein M413DRAFT_444704 [Hebeloma cylindrosporum h7]
MNDSKPTSETVTSFLPNLNLGNGLIEIAALTTLIGSSTAGDLIFGNRGAAGLVWGSISAFGASSVIKACASAASPGWLRQMLGLRTTSSDKALGMDLGLGVGKRVARRMRETLDDPGPIGVSCLSDSGTLKINEYDTYRDVYAFDSATSVTLSEPSSTDSTLIVHTHYPYAFYRPHHLRFQITVLSLSLLKFLEIYALFLMGGTLIAALSAVPFLFSFCSALCLEIHDILAARRPVEVDGHLDLIAASPLPTTKRLGGPRKVVLGALPNPRTSSPWWKFFWIVTGTLQTLFIVLSYVLLGDQKSEFVFTWAGFQLFWLVARILIFNLTENTHPMAGRPMKGSSLEALSPSLRLRVANLVLALGQYQAHVHPRNWDAYLDDSFSTRQIARLLAPENIAEVYPLLPARTSSTSSRDSLQTPSVSSGISPSSTTSFLPIRSEKTMSAAAPRIIKVNILAVIGDTSLSSAAWMLGNSKYSPMDLYDSCIVVFEVTSSSSFSSSSTTLHPSSSSLDTFDSEKHSPNPITPHTQTQTQKRVLAIPAARVFSARSQWFDVIAAQSSSGEDGIEPLFIPRGTGSQVHADEKTWIYWVPCAAFDGEEDNNNNNHRWLQIKSSPVALPASSTSFSPSSLDTTTTTANTNTNPNTMNNAKPPKSAPFISTTSTAKVYSILGHQFAEVLDDTQLSRILGAGKLNISLKNAQEVRGVVEVSRRASEGLRAFLG